LIFQSNDPNRFWDGWFNGSEAPIGVYGYILEYESYGVDPIQKTGTITLLR